MMGHLCDTYMQLGGVTSRLQQCVSSVKSVKIPHCPKTVRLKFSWFIALICVCVGTIVFICFRSCSKSCPGLCNISNLDPVINNAYRYNYSKVRFSHTKRYLPKCIVIGVRKAGTRALLRYLNLHPEIVTATDEIHFFDDDEEYAKGLDYYRRQMPYSFKHQITIEKTPNYFVEPLAPERVYRMNSSILLLLIVRDPITRLISDYTQLREKHIRKEKEVVPFEDEVLDAHGHVRTNYKGVQTSVYSIHLARWLEFFPMKQIHVVDGDLFIANPYQVMKDLETFLGLEHRITADMFFYNSTKGFFCINDGNMSSCLGETKGRRHPEVDPLVLEKLQKFYMKRNEVFYRMVNRTFHW